MSADIVAVLSHPFKECEGVINFQQELREHQWPSIEALQIFLLQFEASPDKDEAYWRSKSELWTWDFGFNLASSQTPEDEWRDEYALRIRAPYSIYIGRRMIMFHTALRWGRIFEEIELRKTLRYQFCKIAQALGSQHILFIPDSAYQTAGCIHTTAIEEEGGSMQTMLEAMSEWAGPPVPWDKAVDDSFFVEGHWKEQMDRIYFLDILK